MIIKCAWHEDSLEVAFIKNRKRNDTGLIESYYLYGDRSHEKVKHRHEFYQFIEIPIDNDTVALKFIRMEPAKLVTKVDDARKYWEYLTEECGFRANHI